MMNEVPGEFPEWVDQNAHNSLIGCMKCQDCCPGNSQNKENIVKGVTFSEEETKELMMHKIMNRILIHLLKKLRRRAFIRSY
jgi:epoxyqueuosine reductase